MKHSSTLALIMSTARNKRIVTLLILLSFINCVSYAQLTVIINNLVDSYISDAVGKTITYQLSTLITYLMVYIIANGVYNFILPMFVENHFSKLKTNMCSFLIHNTNHHSQKEATPIPVLYETMIAADKLSEIIAGDFSWLLRTALKALVSLVICARIHWSLIIVYLFFPLLIHSLKKSAQSVKQETHKELNNIGHASEGLWNYLKGIEVIKTYRLENIAQKELDHSYESILEAETRITRIKTKTKALSLSFQMLDLTVMAVLGIVLISKGMLTVGDFISYSVLNENVWALISMWGNFFSTYQKAESYSNRLLPFLETSYNETRLVNKKGVEFIELKELSFSYSGESKVIANNISIILGKGKTIGIIGNSGEGKTTIGNILCGIERDYSGQILINGEYYWEKTSDILLSNSALVPQFVSIFEGTIKENILLGKKTSDADFKLLLEKTGLLSLINKLPLGEDTVIGNNHHNLSTGEKQRIGIARALAKDSTLIVFDEPTSALDYDNKRKIISTINYLKKNHIILIITHDPVLQNEVDCVYLLSTGKLMEDTTKS